jgi:hypothetical protein
VGDLRTELNDIEFKLFKEYLQVNVHDDGYGVLLLALSKKRKIEFGHELDLYMQVPKLVKLKRNTINTITCDICGEKKREEPKHKLRERIDGEDKNGDVIYDEKDFLHICNDCEEQTRKNKSEDRGNIKISPSRIRSLQNLFRDVLADKFKIILTTHKGLAMFATNKLKNEQEIRETVKAMGKQLRQQQDNEQEDNEQMKYCKSYEENLGYLKSYVLAEAGTRFDKLQGDKAIQSFVMPKIKDKPVLKSLGEEALAERGSGRKFEFRDSDDNRFKQKWKCTSAKAVFSESILFVDECHNLMLNNVLSQFDRFLTEMRRSGKGVSLSFKKERERVLEIVAKLVVNWGLGMGNSEKEASSSTYLTPKKRVALFTATPVSKSVKEITFLASLMGQKNVDALRRGYVSFFMGRPTSAFPVHSPSTDVPNIKLVCPEITILNGNGNPTTADVDNAKAVRLAVRTSSWILDRKLNGAVTWVKRDKEQANEKLPDSAELQRKLMLVGNCCEAFAEPKKNEESRLMYYLIEYLGIWETQCTDPSNEDKISRGISQALPKIEAFKELKKPKTKNNDWKKNIEKIKDTLSQEIQNLSSSQCPKLIRIAHDIADYVDQEPSERIMVMIQSSYPVKSKSKYNSNEHGIIVLTLLIRYACTLKDRYKELYTETFQKRHAAYIALGKADGQTEGDECKYMQVTARWGGKKSYVTNVTNNSLRNAGCEHFESLKDEFNDRNEENVDQVMFPTVLVCHAEQVKQGYSFKDVRRIILASVPDNALDMIQQIGRASRLCMNTVRKGSRGELDIDMYLTTVKSTTLEVLRRFVQNTKNYAAVQCRNVSPNDERKCNLPEGNNVFESIVRFTTNDNNQPEDEHEDENEEMKKEMEEVVKTLKIHMKEEGTELDDTTGLVKTNDVKMFDTLLEEKKQIDTCFGVMRHFAVDANTLRTINEGIAPYKQKQQEEMEKVFGESWS